MNIKTTPQKSGSVKKSDILNRLKKVDQNFQISTDDLCDAIKRVSASAGKSNISFDDLASILQLVKDRTGRGFSIVANSLKTLLVRIQQDRTRLCLDEMGFDIDKNDLDLLKSIKIVLPHLNEESKYKISELIGGVFQAQILKHF